VSGLASDVERAVHVVTLCPRSDVYFADVAMKIGAAGHAVQVRGSCVGRGREVTVARSVSELAERLAHVRWALAGAPPLRGHSLIDGTPVVSDTVAVHLGRTTDADGTGYCAGSDASAAILHGLLEVIERDVVVRVLDEGEAILSALNHPLPECLQELLRNQGASVRLFVCSDRTLPPTVIAAVRSRDGSGGALGSACRTTVELAVWKAIFEGVMMLTTVRHQDRQPAPHAGADGIRWASKNIDALVYELEQLANQRHAAPTANTWPTAGPQLIAVARCARVAFGADPYALRLPDSPSVHPGTEVWRVASPGAVSPHRVRRSPWPMG